MPILGQFCKQRVVLNDDRERSDKIFIEQVGGQVKSRFFTHLSKTIHYIKCSVGLRIDSQMVNSHIG